MGRFNKIIDNVLKGAEASTGANKARAMSNASRRASEVGNAMFDAAAPILMQPEVLASLPKDLASRISLGDPEAVMEGIRYVGRSGKNPPEHPA